MNDARLDHLCEELKKLHDQEKNAIGVNMFSETGEPHDAFIERMEKLADDKELALKNLIQYSSSLCGLHKPDDILNHVYEKVGPKVFDDELELNQEKAFPGATQSFSDKDWRESLTPDFYASSDLYQAQEFGDFPGEVSFKVSYSEGNLSVVLSDVPFPVANKSSDSNELVVTSRAAELMESVHAFLSRDYSDNITVQLDDGMVRRHLQLQESALAVVSARNDLQQALTNSDEIVQKRSLKELATRNFEQESRGFIHHHGERAFRAVMREFLGEKSTLANQTLRKLDLGQELGR